MPDLNEVSERDEDERYPATPLDPWGLLTPTEKAAAAILHAAQVREPEPRPEQEERRRRRAVTRMLAEEANTYTVREADPELERLLAEEEAIERGTHRRAALQRIRDRALRHDVQYRAMPDQNRWWCYTEDCDTDTCTDDHRCESECTCNGGF